MNSRGSGDPTTTDRPGGGSPPAEPIDDRIRKAREALDGARRRGEKTDLLKAQLDGLLRTRDREAASAAPLAQALPPITGGGPDEGDDLPAPARPTEPKARRTQPSAGELAMMPGLRQRIGRLAAEGGMLWVETCVRQIVELWSDHHSVDFHRKTFQRVALGSLPLVAVTDSFEIASGYTDPVEARQVYTGWIKKHVEGKAPASLRRILEASDESAARRIARPSPALVPVPPPVGRRVESAPAEEPALTEDDLAYWRGVLATGSPAWRRKAAEVLGGMAATA